jgi:acetyl esterase/lipase
MNQESVNESTGEPPDAPQATVLFWHHSDWKHVFTTADRMVKNIRIFVALHLISSDQPDFDKACVTLQGMNLSTQKAFPVWLMLSALFGLMQHTNSAANGLALWPVNTSLKITHPIKAERNLRYGPLDHQQLDVYHNHPEGSAPVVVFIYGGGWHKGRKSHYHFVADALVRKGYVVVIPDYSKYPETRFPAFVEDVAQSLAWVKQHIGNHGGHPEQLFLAGHSAGAHIGALLISDASYLQQVGLEPTDISGFAGLAGPYNFTPQAPRYVDTFGRDNFARMKVNNHVNGDEPPVLLLHSRNDRVVGQFNFDTFRNQLEARGGSVQAVLFTDEGHADMVLKLHPWFAGEVDLAVHLDGFFRAQLDATAVVAAPPPQAP